MKTSNEVYEDINKRLVDSTGFSISEGTVMDFYTAAVAESAGDIYREIEEMTNPHIYTKLQGRSLDDLGFFLGIPRETGESDQQYLYRLMDWKYSAEASNQKAIENALLNTVHSSFVTYIPLTYGSGTASVYVIPRDYSNETISAAITEAHGIVSNIVSPSVYVEYIAPKTVPIKLHLALSSTFGDVDMIKERITAKVREYINSVPPQMNLAIGYINKLGIEEEQVGFFNVLQIFVDNSESDEIYIYQDLDSKFILDEIIWS